MNKLSVKRIIGLAVLMGVIIIGGSVGMGLGLSSIRTYGVSTEANIETTQLEGKGSYRVGQEVTLVAGAVDGYRFSHWEYARKKVSEESTYTFKLTKQNTGKYTAVYNKEYSVTISETIANGQVGFGDGVTTLNAIKNEDVTLTTQADAGYRIKRLYYKLAGVENATEVNISSTFKMPAGNVVVFATFEQEYTAEKAAVIVNGNISFTGNFEENEQSFNAVEGENVTVYIRPNNNYVLDKLYYIMSNAEDNENNRVEISMGETNYQFTMPRGNVVVKALLKEREYAVNITNYTGATITSDKQSAVQGDDVTLTIIPPAGYEIMKVYYFVGGVETEIVDFEVLPAGFAYMFAMPNSDITIQVDFVC